MVLSSSDLNKTDPSLEYRLGQLSKQDGKTLLADTAVETMMRILQKADLDNVEGDYEVNFRLGNGSLASESLQIHVSKVEKQSANGTFSLVTLTCQKYGVFKEFTAAGENYRPSSPVRGNSPGALQKFKDFFKMDLGFGKLLEDNS